MKRLKCDRVEVTWEDSTLGHVRWTDLADAKRVGTRTLCTSVGLLIRKDRRWVVLATSGQHVSPIQVTQVVTIPRSAVRKIRTLR